MTDIPVGGTTSLSHEHSAQITEAAHFLAAIPLLAQPRPLLPALRQMFGLTTVECCEAVHDSRLYQQSDGALQVAGQRDRVRQNDRACGPSG